MTNNLNEKKSTAIISAAIIATLLFMLSSFLGGLVCAIRQKHESRNSEYARYLLIDAAANLRGSLSALRLCNESGPARELEQTALVYAVRAETAMECREDDWHESEKREAFLNDVATVLHSDDPMYAVKLSDVLFGYSDMFYKHVADGAEFDYNGELSDLKDPTESTYPTDEEIEKAQELVQNVLRPNGIEAVGGWDGLIEFSVERDGKYGYAVVKGEKIIEFSYAHGAAGATDDDSAKQIALDCAKACGFDGLSVYEVDGTGGATVVKMCYKADDAMCCDDCARVVVSDGKAVAFTSGNCDCEHDGVPQVKVSERDARKAAIGGGEGVLVARNYGGRERVCYEYRYELEDGVHFVYVCAENGKQMQVK